MNILFLNVSPNKNGNTARLAKTLLAGKEYQTLQLTDYKIYDYGQDFPDDQFEVVLEQVLEADTIIIGSPVYWHSFTGLLRNFMDRQYGAIQDELVGKKLIFLFQGSAPTPDILKMGNYSMSRYTGLYGMDYLGMATNTIEARELASKL